MALPDYSYFSAGTSITWTVTGSGDKIITLTSLAAAAAKEGGKSDTLLDGTKGYPAFLEIRLEFKPVSTPTDAGTIDLYIGESDSATAGTANPGGLTGADATVTTPAQQVRQLNYAGSLVLSAALSTAVQVTRFRYYPTCICIIPVLVNNCSVSASGTGSDHKVIVTPYYGVLAE